MQFEMTKCLFCGHHSPIIKTGVNRIQKGKGFDRPYTFRYDHVDSEESAFISIRDCQGRKGLPEIGRITLREAMKNPEYKEIISTLQNQCIKILKILTEEKE